MENFSFLHGAAASKYLKSIDPKELKELLMDTKTNNTDLYPFAGVIHQGNGAKASIVGFVSEGSATFYGSYVPKEMWGCRLSQLVQGNYKVLTTHTKCERHKPGQQHCF